MKNNYLSNQSATNWNIQRSERRQDEFFNVKIFKERTNKFFILSGDIFTYSKSKLEIYLRGY